MGTERRKYSLRLGDQTFWYFLTRKVRGEPSLQLGFPGADEPSAQGKHLDIFVEGETLHVLIADESKSPHSPERHQAVARIPLRRLGEALMGIESQAKALFNSFCEDYVLIARPESLWGYEFIINLPLTKEALAEFEKSNRKGTAVDVLKAISEIRLVTGDRLAEAGAGMAVLITWHEPTRMWRAPWCCWGISTDGLVALCKTEALRELAKLGAKFWKPLAEYFESDTETSSAGDFDLYGGYPFAWSDEEVRRLRSVGRSYGERPETRCGGAD